ncbi:MAG TPA: N-acetyltransferase [Candidatus Acidoferrales bacterium]|nr:N-acetyltransferase [Candidatus Acidoferrales bacterium]
MPVVKFTIRRFRPADLGTLYAIDQSCYSPAIAYSLAELQWYLRLPGAACLVATAGKEIIGFILVSHNRGHGHIITIDVLAPHRQHGIGSALLRKSERILLAAGTREVWLETATDNVAAIAFWQKHGYRTRGRMKNYYPGGLDAFAMSKRLRGSAAQEN